MKESATLTGKEKGVVRRRAGKQRREQALTRVELLAVLAVLGMFAVLAMPLLGNTALRTQRTVCVNNLRQIAVGYRAFAMNNQGRYPWNINSNAAPGSFIRDAGSELGTPRIMVCPSDSAKTLPNPLNFTNFNSSLNLSYFLNRYAQEYQSGSWLAGDRNISAANYAILTNSAGLQWNSGNNHDAEGNIVLVDGHVQQFNQTALKASADRVLSNSYPISLYKP
jgi:type II secretory pathway pseudopilin PulG